MATVDELVLKVTVDNQVDFGGLLSGFGAIDGVLGILSGALNGITDAFTTVGEKAWDFAKDATGAFMSYEDQLALVGKTTGYAGEELKDLGDTLRELAKPIGSLMAEDLLKVAQVAGQLGIQGKDDIALFSREIGIGTIALDKFGGNTEKLAGHIAKSQTIFGDSTSATGNYLSTLDALSKSTNANELEISNFNLAMGQFNATMGLSYAESSALGAVMVSGGIAAGKAATQIGSAYTQLSTKAKAMDAATAMLSSSADGGAASIAELERITGQSRETFQSTGDMIKFALGENAFETMNLLVGEWDKIPNSAERIAQGLDRMTLGTDMFGAVGMKSMSVLSEAINKQDEDLKSLAFALGVANGAYAEGQSHLDSYQQQVDKTSEKSKVLGSVFNDILLTIGEPLAKALGELYDKIIPVVDAFATWIKENETFQLVLNTVITTLQDIAGSVLDTVIEQFKKWFDYVSVNGPTLWEQIVAGAEKFGQGLVDLGVQVKDFFVALTDPEGSAQNFFADLFEFIRQIDWGAAFTALKDSAMMVFSFLSESLPGLIEGFVNVGSSLDDVIEIVNFFKTAWDAVSGIISKVFDAFQSSFDFFVGGLDSIVRMLEGDVSGGFRQLQQVVGDVARGIVDQLVGLFDAPMQAMKGFFDGIVDYGAKAVQKVTDLAQSIKNMIPFIKEAEQESTGNSLFPDMVTWAGRSAQTVDGLSRSIGGMAQKVASSGSALGSMASQTAQLAQQSAKLSQALATVSNRPVAPRAPAVPRHILSPTPVVRQTVTVGAVAPVGRGAQSQPQTTVVFNGLNAVDPGSTQRLVQHVSQVQRKSATHVF